MPVVPASAGRELSSDGRHNVDDLDQQSLQQSLVTADWKFFAIEISPDDDALELGSGAKTLTKGSGSAGAKGFTLIDCSAATPICTEED
ncbi:hypothetical protein Tco_0151757 [Tanacetum coccineum]